MQIGRAQAARALVLESSHRDDGSPLQAVSSSSPSSLWSPSGTPTSVSCARLCTWPHRLHATNPGPTARRLRLPRPRPSTQRWPSGLRTYSGTGLATATPCVVYVFCGVAVGSSEFPAQLRRTKELLGCRSTCIVRHRHKQGTTTSNQGNPHRFTVGFSAVGKFPSSMHVLAIAGKHMVSFWKAWIRKH